MKLLLTEEAEKQFTKLPKSDRPKIEKKLKQLKENPHLGKKLTGEYTNQRSLRVWPYRIIYLINIRKEIIILSIIHRQGAYK